MESLLPNIIKAQKNNFHFQVMLKNDQCEQFLAIQLLHCESKEKYFLQINQKSIQNIEGLSKLYENPTQLYFQIQEIIDQLNIDSAGVITFEVIIGKSKRRTITLATEKQKQKGDYLHQLTAVDSKVDSLKALFQKETQQIKLEQQKLAKQLRQLQIVGQLKNEIISQKKQIQCLKNDLVGMKQALKQKNSQNIGLFKRFSKLNKELKQIKSLYQNWRVNLATQQRTKTLQDDRQKPEKQYEKQQEESQQQIFLINTKKEHRQLQSQKSSQIANFPKKQTKNKAYNEQLDFHGQVTQRLPQQQGQIVKINYVRGCQQHQANNLFAVSKLSHNIIRLSRYYPPDRFISFIHEYRFCTNKMASIKVVVAHSQDNEIYLGVCTKKVFNRGYICRFKQCLSLNFQDSSIINGGHVVLQGDYSIEAKKVVEMEVDMINTKITWKIQVQKDKYKIIHSIDLPKKMKKKPIFIHLAMKNNNDLLDIITD